MSPLRRVSIWAVGLVVFLQSGLKNLLWTSVMMGAPLVTAGFVYQVVAMHQARLQHEFTGRTRITWTHDDLHPDLLDVEGPLPSLADARPEPNLRQRLFTMLIEQSRFMEVSGLDPSGMTSSVLKTARAMAVEDERMFVKLQAEKKKDLDTYLFDWRSDEERLRVLHAQLKILTARAAREP